MVTRFDSIWQNRGFLRQADMSIQAFSPGGFGEKDLWDPWQQTRWIRVVRTVQVYTRAQFIKRSRNTKRVIFARKCYSIIFCLFVCLFVCLSLLLLMLQTRFDDCNFQLKYLISITIICIISAVTRNQSYGYPCHPQWEDDFSHPFQAGQLQELEDGVEVHRSEVGWKYSHWSRWSDLFQTNLVI